VATRASSQQLPGIHTLASSERNNYSSWSLFILLMKILPMLYLSSSCKKIELLKADSSVTVGPLIFMAWPFWSSPSTTSLAERYICHLAFFACPACKLHLITETSSDDPLIHRWFLCLEFLSCLLNQFYVSLLIFWSIRTSCKFVCSVFRFQNGILLRSNFAIYIVG
jgi:hypothetical protein